ncbi:MAG: F0F1 ATP synthase subunit delta [Deltaproteobacteria bacterium]|nr:F0F1 ATP synthase subunit delta [Deltaproteobacteria bacterium]
MRQGSIAKRYASALLQVAQDQGKVDEYQQELQLLVQTFVANPGLQTAMTSPVVPPSKKMAIFTALAPKLGISVSVRNLIHILVDQERISELGLIDLIYRDLSDELKGRVRVQVTSAVALGANEAKLKAVLESSLKQEVQIEAKVDPEILGGLVVRVQDRIFNASLKGELERLKESLTAEAVA